MDIYNTSNLINLKVLDIQNILEVLQSRYKNNKIYTKINQILLALNPFKKINISHDDPHPDELALNCFEDMIKQNTNHSILVSGESGAGKTETTKILLKKLLSLSSQNNSLLEQIYWSNYILEAFGNSKTIRNHNSSRFGKFINIYFKDKEIIGAKIETYLLEKIRVTHKSIDERNFHIFYMLFPQLINEKFIKTNNPYDDNLNDEEALQELQKAFKFFNISDQDYELIKNIIHSIILFSDFYKNKKHISQLLQVSLQQLEDKINFQFIKVGNETIKKPLEEKDIKIKIQTLCNDLYSKLFNYLVSLINIELSKNLDKHNNYNSISLLDIFGFEILQDNSIEQLCINYTNEILQNTFNQYFFEKEQEIYIQEGLPYDLVKFENNDKIIHSIENKVFKTINEVSTFIKPTPSQIIDKLFKIKSNTINISNLQKSKKLFNINHYADTVEYNLSLFIQKNKLNLPEDIVSLLKLSNNKIIQQLSFQKSKNSLLESFKKQIKLLKNKINKTKVNFIRCIKPNDIMKPLQLDTKRTKEQLKYNGVIEAIRVARQGYPIRIPNSLFDLSYFMIPKQKLDFIIRGKTLTFMTHNDENKLENIKKSILNSNAITIQKNIKMFIQKKNFLLSLFRIIKIQSIFRCYKQYKTYQKLLQNLKSIIIQKYWKMFYFTKKYRTTKFIVYWITLRKIKQNNYKKLLNKKSNIIKKYFYTVLFNKSIRSLLTNIKNLKQFILIIKAKQQRIILRKQAKDIGNLKQKLKLLEENNKRLEQERIIQEQNLLEQRKNMEKEQLEMLKEDIYIKQLIEEEKYKQELDLRQLEKEELQKEKESLNKEKESLNKEKEELNKENIKLAEAILHKDIEHINKFIKMEAEINRLKRQITEQEDKPPGCIIS